MTEIPFYVTRMGRVFYEHTAPELVRQLELLNRNLERLIDTQNPKPRNETDGHDTHHEEEDQPPHA